MRKETKPDLTLTEELKRLLPGPRVQVAWLVLTAVIVWFYWWVIKDLVVTWWSQEDYQHGFFVPIFAVALLWLRRDMMAGYSGVGSWWGMVFFGIWAAMRWMAVYFGYGISVTEMSLIPFFAGVALFVGGWQGLRWSWPAVIFLFFMIPLPGNVQGIASHQLQVIATRISVYVIQTLGIPSVAQGNEIQLSERSLEVARACSGLRMMMLFFAICIGAALMSRRPLWERLIMVASAAPIAILSNVIRIIATALLYELAAQWPTVVNVETVGEQVHQWAGYLMMPIGLLLLLAEMTLLAKLLVAPGFDRPLVMDNMLSGERTGAAVEQAVLRRRRR